VQEVRGADRRVQAAVRAEVLGAELGGGVPGQLQPHDVPGGRRRGLGVGDWRFREKEVFAVGRGGSL